MGNYPRKQHRDDSILLVAIFKALTPVTGVQFLPLVTSFSGTIVFYNSLQSFPKKSNGMLCKVLLRTDVHFPVVKTPNKNN